MSIQPISGSAASLPATPPSQVAPNNAPLANAPVAASPAPSPARAAPTVPEAATAQESKRAASAAELRSSVQDAVKRANETVQVLRSNLQFTVDQATGIDVVKFIDIKTKEVIRQIPSEEMVALARRLDEIRGLLIKDKA